MPHMLRFTSAPGWIFAALQSSFQVRAVRDIILATTFAHMSRRGAHMSGREELVPFMDRRKRSVEHYGRALRLLTCEEPPAPDVVLVCCLLFHCYEHFAGRHLTAFKHIRSGMKLLNSTCTPESQPGSPHALPNSLRMASAFAQSNVIPEMGSIVQIPVWRDWESFIWSDSQEPPTHSFAWFACPWKSFTRLTEAREILDRILASLSCKRELHDVDDALSHTFEDIGRLLTDWSSAFDAFRGESTERLTQKPEPLLLEIHYTLALIMHATQGPLPPMHEQFEALLELCEVFISSDRISPVDTSSPWLGMDLGLIPPLFFTAMLAEDVVQRQTAIRLLHSTERYENIWNGCLAAKIADGLLGLEQEALRDDTYSPSPYANRHRVNILDVEKHGEAQIRLKYTTADQPNEYLLKVLEHPSMPLDTTSIVWPIRGYLTSPGYQGLVLYRKARCQCFNSDV